MNKLSSWCRDNNDWLSGVIVGIAIGMILVGLIVLVLTS